MYNQLVDPLSARNCVFSNYQCGVNLQWRPDLRVCGQPRPNTAPLKSSVGYML